jgi:hypothetical protein
MGDQPPSPTLCVEVGGFLVDYAQFFSYPLLRKGGLSNPNNLKYEINRMMSTCKHFNGQPVEQHCC